MMDSLNRGSKGQCMDLKRTYLTHHRQVASVIFRLNYTMIECWGDHIGDDLCWRISAVLSSEEIFTLVDCFFPSRKARWPKEDVSDLVLKQRR